jgi:hypothetical protein
MMAQNAPKQAQNVASVAFPAPKSKDRATKPTHTIKTILTLKEKTKKDYVHKN